MHGPSRMVGRNIQSFKVVVVRLHLGAGSDGVARLAEDLDDARHGHGVGMAPPSGPLASGQGDIHRLRRQLGFQGRPLQGLAPGLERRLHLFLSRIDRGPRGGPFLRRQLPEGLQHPRERPLLPQISDAKVFEGRQILGLRHLAQGFFPHCGQFIHALNP